MKLSTTEEKIILQSIQEDGNIQNKEILLSNNMGLICAYANRYDRSFYKDMIQEASIGLLMAADRYEFDRGTKFSTYATFWINAAVNRSYYKLKRSVRIPSTTQELINKIKRCITKYMTEYHHTPTVEEISKITGLNYNKIEYYQQIDKDSLSLDSILNDHDSTIADYIPDEGSDSFQHDVEAKELKSILKDAVDELSQREREVLSLNFGLRDIEPLSLAEIGRRFNVSRERIRQIKKRALMKIRESNYGEVLKDFL